MGKKGSKKLTSTQGGGQNLKSVLRHEHLKNLALWASTGDTPIPSLASLFGRRLSADEESSGIATDPDIVFCQRCETILKPGVNCNVRIEKVSSANKKKRTKCKKSNICLPQNNVVYHCNFCSHRNLKRGTLKGQMKEIYPSKPKTSRSIRPKITKEMMMPEKIQSNMLSSPERSEKDQVEDSVMNTPKPMLTLDRDKRIRKSKSKKPIEPESVSEKTVGGSNKRKRKSWTDMKESAETNKTSKGDINRIVCKACVKTATIEIAKNCSNHRKAIIYYFECMVRYSDKYFLSTLETNPNSTSMSDDPIPKSFGKFGQILSDKMEEVINRSSKFSSSRTPYYLMDTNTYNNLYDLESIGQCTPHLDPKNCTKCLKLATQEIRECCSGKLWGLVSTPKCFVSFATSYTPTKYTFPPYLSSSFSIRGSKKRLGGMVLDVAALVFALMSL